MDKAKCSAGAWENPFPPYQTEDLGEGKGLGAALGFFNGCSFVAQIF